MRILALVAICTVLFAPRPGPSRAQSTQSGEPVALPSELQQVLKDYETAWRTKDAMALAQLFTEDGFVLSPGEPMVRGRAAIRKFYAGAGGPLFLHAAAFGMEGTIGYIIGGFSHRRGAADDGKFTLTLRKGSSGPWLIFSDMDNSSHKPRSSGS